MLQPLDVGLFSPLGRYYKEELDSLLRYRHGYKIQKLNFVEIRLAAM